MFAAAETAIYPKGFEKIELVWPQQSPPEIQLVVFLKLLLQNVDRDFHIKPSKTRS